MTTIRVAHRQGPSYLVTIEEATGITTHAVTVQPADIARYAPDSTADELVAASFRFLLEREPKEAILTRFELSLIERYFPDYPTAISAYLSR